MSVHRSGTGRPGVGMSIDLLGLAELAFLSGRDKLPGCDVQSLVVYETE